VLFRSLGSTGAWEERRLFKRRPCGDAPMIWKECTGTLSSGSTVKTAIILLLGLGAAVGLAYWVYELGVPAFQETLDYGYGSTGAMMARNHMSISVRILTGVLYVLMALMLAASAATGFTIEREKDTWVSLVATPLDGAAIVTGKILGAFWRVRGLLVTLLLVWLIGMLCGAVHPLGFLAAIVLTSLYTLFIDLVGTCFSLRFKSSARALTATIGVLVFLNGGYLFCCIPFLSLSGTIVILGGFTPLIVTGAVFTFADLDGFLYLSGRHTISDRGELFMMVFFSIVFHASAAFALLHTCLNQFENEVDRPRRLLLGFCGPVSREGIRFEDEQDMTDDGISFVATADPVETASGEEEASFDAP
jgi:ABC-type transport system involved in multi-copper enzyme maturation permease subunit